jgi:hypothetical protein
MADHPTLPPVLDVLERRHGEGPRLASGRMMPDPSPDMLAAALDAYDNGICVVRARTDGSKRPVGEWKKYQVDRPTREQVITWFSDGHAGMGAICGAVSGDLEMFELEGRFVSRYGTADFVERMNAAGHELLMKRLLNGIVIESPSDGRHLLYRCADAAVDGNTKLANNAASETLIETRGEGGFVVLPPSHGTVHPTGKAWERTRGSFASIPTITAIEREALFTVARSYDETPPKADPTPVDPADRVAQQRWTGGQVADSWIETVEAHLVSTWTMVALLEHYGWTTCYLDKHGRQLVHRPGKDGDGVGGSINGADRFHPFSSSTPFPGASASKLSPTFDRLDIIATYEFAGDRMAAARYIADTTGILKAWQRAKDDEAAKEFRYTPPNVNADGEFVPPIIDAEDLWDARPALQHIRQAARARMVSPFAVLGCVLARVAAFTPPSTCLPAIIGGHAPLSLFVALRGASGAGKSTPALCAADLLPDIPPKCLGPISLGSGEGLVEAFMELVEETDGGGKAKKVKRQTMWGVLFSLDEGQALSEMGSRKGSTILPVLRTAWSGGDPGQANASIETRRHLRPGSYHVGLVSLWQDKAATALLADADGGTPQRFVWLPTNDPGASYHNRPTWPGAMPWERPPLIVMGGIVQPCPMGVAREIMDEIGLAREAGLHGKLEEDPLDAHRRLNCLKVAGVLAVLDGRSDITTDDWALAGRIMKISDDVRSWVMAESRRREVERVTGDALRMAHRDAVIEQTVTQRALASAARGAYKAVTKGDGNPVGRRQIHFGIASRDRKNVSVEEAIAEAERLLWITPQGDGWVVGKARPS